MLELTTVSERRACRLAGLSRDAFPAIFAFFFGAGISTAVSSSNSRRRSPSSSS